AAADGVVGGAVVDIHALAEIAHGDGTGRVGADVIVLDQVAARAAIGDLDAVAGETATDDVAGAAGQSADAVARGPVADLDTVALLTQGDRATDIDANVVAQNHVAAGTDVVEVGAVAQGGPEDVALAGAGAADDVVRGAVGD